MVVAGGKVPKRWLCFSECRGSSGFDYCSFLNNSGAVDKVRKKDRLKSCGCRAETKANSDTHRRSVQHILESGAAILVVSRIVEYI